MTSFLETAWFGFRLAWPVLTWVLLGGGWLLGWVLSAAMTEDWNRYNGLKGKREEAMCPPFLFVVLARLYMWSSTIALALGIFWVIGKLASP